VGFYKQINYGIPNIATALVTQSNRLFSHRAKNALTYDPSPATARNEPTTGSKKSKEQKTFTSLKKSRK